MLWIKNFQSWYWWKTSVPRKGLNRCHMNPSEWKAYIICEAKMRNKVYEVPVYTSGRKQTADQPGKCCLMSGNSYPNLPSLPIVETPSSGLLWLPLQTLLLCAKDVFKIHVQWQAGIWWEETEYSLLITVIQRLAHKKILQSIRHL